MSPKIEQEQQAKLMSAYQHILNNAPENMPLLPFDEMLKNQALKAVLVARLGKPLISTQQRNGQMKLFS